MSEPTCTVCSTQDERAEQTIFENEAWRATLSANQGYLGALFIELLNHREAMCDLTDADWLSFARMVRLVERAERKAFGAKVLNWTYMMNNFYKSIPPKPHVHWHVKPRYDHDVVVLGKTFIDPNFGHHYDREHMTHVSPEVKDSIAAELRAAGAG